MSMESLDASVTRAIHGLSGHSPILDTAMVAVSTVGIPLMVLAVAGQWWVGHDRRGTRHVLVNAGIAFLLGLALNQVILLLVDRTRPYLAGVTDLLVAPSADPSFPSDHATAAFAIATAFALGRMPRRALGFGMAALLVAFSRVFIGIHYAGDVLGGALTGALAATVVASLYIRGTRVDRFVTSIL